MSSGKPKHVLIAVLDWGLGHATRCIPVISSLLKNNCRVSIAGNGASLMLLRQEFPQLSFHELPAYKVTYSSHGYFFLNLASQVPRLFKAISKEKKQIEKLVSENQIDVIISDNRYGCYSDKVPSIFITHQLNIQLPAFLSWSRFIVDYINHHLIKKFDSCWVPDFPDSRLSGKLSITGKLKPQFIGTLSRFCPGDVAMEKELLVGLVSGPEPQREIFEKLLTKEFKKLNRPGIIVRGLPNLITKKFSDGNLTLIAHAPSRELERIISKADVIISRSGYSTIMDLYVLGKKRVIFVPTPGQTEQEYLAKDLEKRKIAFMQTQRHFSLEEAIKKTKHYTGFDVATDHTNLLDEAVKNLLLHIESAT
jgi:uncharacterized protein (TIGR00661 family)